MYRVGPVFLRMRIAPSVSMAFADPVLKVQSVLGVLGAGLSLGIGLRKRVLYRFYAVVFPQAGALVGIEKPVAQYAAWAMRALPVAVAALAIITLEELVLLVQGTM